MRRNPAEDPKIGDVWREKNNTYTVTIRELSDKIVCSTNSIREPNHHFSYRWFKDNISRTYDFVIENVDLQVSLLQQQIIQKQKELNQLIEELCKLTSQN